MKKFFTKKSLIILLLLAILCVCVVAASCVNNPPSNNTPPSVGTYVISFDTGVSGLTVVPIVAKAGDSISAPTEPQREGWRFKCWTLNGEPYEFTVMPSENITLVAAWTQLYSVTFITGNTNENSVAWYAAGETIQAPKAVTRNCYKLVGWLLDDQPYEFGAMPDRNITLCAVWDFIGLPRMDIDLSDGNGNQVNLSDVNREQYVNSTISLTNTDEEYELDSLKSEFKGRGNGSWTDIPYDKKGYKIKFDKKQSLFGREKNKHWVIIACVNFDDVTMSRNYLAYNMANEVFDGIEYTTTAYWIDVYVNGEYRGVYLLCEHVRVGEGRVDIESEYGVQDTGYLIEYDAYATGKEGVDYFRVDGLKYPFTVHSPDPEDREKDSTITEAEFMQQIKYIQNYVAQVYQAALSGNYTAFAELADTDSFVDMYILHELFKNTDTGYSSFYLYKKPGGKLYAGPAWDFDATTSTATDRGDRSPQGIYVAGTGAGSAYQASNHTASELYIELYKTSGFLRDVTAHWKVLSPNIKTFLDGRLNDSVYEDFKQSMGANFARWKGETQSQAEINWVNNAKALKQWLLDRIAWLDNTWK